MKNRDVVQRAWNRLRLALLWARKGGVLRRKLVMELRVLPKYLKCLGQKTPPISQAHYYYERELSFDNTPIFNGKMYRPFSTRFRILPCLMNPQVDFDNDDDQFEYDSAGREISNLNDEEEEVDERAEEFIAKFYQQLKMQRQISYLQYNNES